MIWHCRELYADAFICQLAHTSNITLAYHLRHEAPLRFYSALYVNDSLFRLKYGYLLLGIICAILISISSPIPIPLAPG